MANFDGPQTRPALHEIPMQLGSFPAGTTPTTRPILNTGLIDSPTTNIPLSYLSPSLSPDELVIQQRGRRRIPISWSPDKSQRSPMKTPTKGISAMILRSSPRKRALLMDFSSSSSLSEFGESPRKGINNASSSNNNNNNYGTKKMKIEQIPLNRWNSNVPLPTLLQGLSHGQLVQMIQDMVCKQPELEEQIRSDLPMPDIRPMEEALIVAKKNIFKNLPASRLVSKTDNAAYAKVASYMTAFKKTVVDQSKLLNESNHWDALLDYVVLAWKYVKATPIWDNHAHNSVRRHCFKILSFNAVSALKNGGIALGEQRLADFAANVKHLANDCEDINASYQYLNFISKNI